MYKIMQYIHLTGRRLLKKHVAFERWVGGVGGRRVGGLGGGRGVGGVGGTLKHRLSGKGLGLD